MSSNIFGYSTATNFSNRLPDTAALANFVTLNTTQTITGQKTFTAPLTVAGLTATTINSSGAITTDTALNVQKLSANRGAVLIVPDPGSATYNPMVQTYDSVITAKTVDNTLNLSALTLTANGSTSVGVRISAITNTVFSYSGANSLALGSNVVATGTDFRVVNPTTTEGQFLVKPYSNLGDYNPITKAGDVVLCARSNDTTQQIYNTIALTVYGATNSGVRVTFNTVTMGAGASGVDPSAYLTVNNGGTPQSVGPIPATTDSSTKIATTQWVQSLVATLAPTVSFFMTPNAPGQNVYYTVPVVEGLGANIVYLAVPSTSSNQVVYLKFPIPSGQFANKQVIIRLPDLDLGNIMNGNWYVTSTDMVTPIICAGIQNVPVVTYNLNSYVAATWLCDGQYWYLLSRV